MWTLLLFGVATCLPSPIPVGWPASSALFLGGGNFMLGVDWFGVSFHEDLPNCLRNADQWSSTLAFLLNSSAPAHREGVAP